MGDTERSTGSRDIPFGDLRGMLQYVPQFRGRTFVVAIDGSVAASVRFSNILLDLAALRSLSIHIVLVHGASHQIRSLAAQRGVAISNDDGTGITDEATLELSLDAITRLTSTLMQHLTTKELRVATANALIAHRAGILKGVDQGHTGRIDRVDEASLRTLLDDGIIPVVPPLGYDGVGNTLRINSDEVAMEIAQRLGASKIIFLTGDAEGAGTGMPEPRQLSTAQAKELLAGTGYSPGIRSKLESAVRACEGGVQRAHLVDAGAGDAPLLAELFSIEGIGTMVFADAYQNVRAAKRSDVEDLISMMRPAVEREKLLYRSREEIVEKLGDYHVIEVDGSVVGTVAVHFYGKEKAVELACLFVKRPHESRGYGRELVNFAVEKARELGAARIFALSTQSYEFFSTKCGFETGDVDVLPKERREYYIKNSRNSRVLVRELG